ncbi:hypothetical protein [Acinetobacter sp. ANC 4648]|uniref:hypothetical protein n=1 Tax=Acinetobacter sp. ANC 4648 TaxID=1977875 RepID=UPI000A335AD3|nr:hypothetical protein [Acinetobacter sp. ANC 4648]OTG84805.1 hypothetical protein B9T27_00885 [Acinetobacter sp. ANC 4648]
MPLDHRENSKLIWMIAGGLIAIILLVIIYLWMSNTTEPKNQPVQNKMATAQVQDSAPPLAHSAEQTATSEPSTSTLDDEKILKDEVPKNATAAKEEMAKLEDIQKQLDEQAQTLQTQHTDADQLIKLKEEQIQLLEQQLAQTQK